MTKPSDFSPSEALEVSSGADTKRSLRARWFLRLAGFGILIFGWLAVSLDDLGGAMFIIDTAVFGGMAVYAFAAASTSRKYAVDEERKLRLRLLVHNMELENLSMRDDLTQLFNRRYLFDRLERELHTAEGFQRPLAYITIEMKSLNHVNHTYGYAVGDQLLAAFGRFLMELIRATDIPGRVSGNKFGVILPDTSKRGAHTMIERLTYALATTPLTDNPALDSAFVASFGISGYPWGGDSIDAIVRQAETGIAHSNPPELAGASSDKEENTDIPAAFRRLDEVPKES